MALFWQKHITLNKNINICICVNESAFFQVKMVFVDLFSSQVRCDFGQDPGLLGLLFQNSNYFHYFHVLFFHLSGYIIILYALALLFLFDLNIIIFHNFLTLLLVLSSKFTQTLNWSGEVCFKLEIFFKDRVLSPLK